MVDLVVHGDQWARRVSRCVSVCRKPKEIWNMRFARIAAFGKHPGIQSNLNLFRKLFVHGRVNFSSGRPHCRIFQWQRQRRPGPEAEGQAVDLRPDTPMDLQCGPER